MSEHLTDREVVDSVGFHVTVAGPLTLPQFREHQRRAACVRCNLPALAPELQKTGASA